MIQIVWHKLLVNFKYLIYLLETKQNFLKNIYITKKPIISLLDGNVSMYTNQFISQRMQIHIENRKTNHTRAVLTIARGLKLPKLP